MQRNVRSHYERAQSLECITPFDKDYRDVWLKAKSVGYKVKNMPEENVLRSLHLALDEIFVLCSLPVPDASVTSKISELILNHYSNLKLCEICFAIELAVVRKLGQTEEEKKDIKIYGRIGIDWVAAVLSLYLNFRAKAFVIMNNRTTPASQQLDTSLKRVQAESEFWEKCMQVFEAWKNGSPFEEYILPEIFQEIQDRGLFHMPTKRKNELMDEAKKKVSIESISNPGTNSKMLNRIYSQKRNLRGNDGRVLRKAMTMACLEAFGWMKANGIEMKETEKSL